MSVSNPSSFLLGSKSCLLFAWKEGHPSFFFTWFDRGVLGTPEPPESGSHPSSRSDGKLLVQDGPSVTTCGGTTNTRNQRVYFEGPRRSREDTTPSGPPACPPKDTCQVEKLYVGGPVLGPLHPETDRALPAFLPVSPSWSVPSRLLSRLLSDLVSSFGLCPPYVTAPYLTLPQFPDP